MENVSRPQMKRPTSLNTTKTTGREIVEKQNEMFI